MSDKLHLPQVTLVCVDCLNTERAIIALEESQRVCTFGAVKFFTSCETEYPHIRIPAIDNLYVYSRFMLKSLHTYLNTSHVLVVQHDGWVLNADAWDDAWLNVDYIGGLFPEHTQVMSNSVGNGGFSLRSTLLMSTIAHRVHSRYGLPVVGAVWPHEDGVICHTMRKELESLGFVYASHIQAAHFAYTGNPNHQDTASFGFHGFTESAKARIRTGVNYS